MRLTDLNPSEIEPLLAGQGIGLDFGAARARIRSDARGLAAALVSAYRAFPMEPADGFFDVTVFLRRVRGIRRHIRPQVELFVDGESLFAPFPADTHLPLLEWGMNLVLAERLGVHLLLHAGVVEMEGRAVILPALPGSGKSTLTAALICRGFRLLSDEFGVVRLDDGRLLPLLRPVALKNESIEVIARFGGEPLGPSFAKTRKGTVAHLAPNRGAVDRRAVPAVPAVIIFPRFEPGVGLRIEQEKASRAFGRLAVNSFNYEMLGLSAFDAVAGLVAGCPAYQLTYSNLDAAVEKIRALVAQSA